MTAEAKLDWQELIEEAITAPGRLSECYNRFYTYSFLNQILLRMQGVHEPVATYKRWQSLGRQVLRGSKAKAILRPINVKREDDEGNEINYRRFKYVNCLFGVSETEGDELPPAEIPDWDLETAHQELGIRQVPYESLDGNMQGYSWHCEYALNPVAEDPDKTRFHEIGHIIVGHTTDERLAEYQQHRGVFEFQAEATSYLSSHELGIASEESEAHSRGYIRHWIDDERPSDVSIREVFKATDLILRAGRVQSEAGLVVA